jgi:type IV pilus assembly protein PilB
MVLSDAIHAGASDIHVEPQPDSLRIRYRVDGLLREVMTVPRSALASVVSRMKIISGLDIAERRVPQDGRTRISVDGTELDARVSTMPSIHGEKVVIRLLARAEQVRPLADCGLDDEQLRILRGAIGAPQGLILITGPTGSGKTSTLYSTLREIHTPDRNLVTLEDPVEIQLPGVTQTQVNERAGLTFSRGLRSVLRQDPDVVLVGEVRDGETAELVIKAAQTGHLVLSTLHTNNAVAAITRLVDLGVEPFLVASSLSCVVAQRLVRVPCASCAVPDVPGDDVLDALGLDRSVLEGATPLRGSGCGECAGSGYRGRTGVYEVVRVDQTLRRVLLAEPTESALAAATDDQPTLKHAALALALTGGTTFDEVLRVSPRD